MISSKAFAPANISCIFRIYGHKNPRLMGSYGIGFTLNEGVIAEVSKAKKNEVFYNNRSISFPTIISVINRLTKEKLKVYIKARLPLGCGFGLSGASALATAYAINGLLKLKKSKKELAIIAHTAEVENKTGLGDVVNQYYGGFCIKSRPSSYFRVEKLSLSNIDVYCRHFGRISTKSIITNAKIRNKINDAADSSLSKIQSLTKYNKNKIKFKDVIRISKEFAVNSGLLKNKKIIRTIKNIEKNGGNASMIMLGNSVFSDRKFKGASRFKISGKGAHLI